MEKLLQLFVLIPLLGFLVTLCIPRRNERAISLIAVTTAVLQLAGIIAFIIFWLIQNHPVLDIRHLVVFKNASFEIFINYFFDGTTAVFVLVGAIIMCAVSVFSHNYVHREPGFKRFYSTLLFFYAGYNILLFAGNFETLFVGWEMVGISSFLLITFYRDRYLPVKNGLKVISFYRMGDICLMLAMWMNHHLWHENITFSRLSDASVVAGQVQGHYPEAIFIALMVFMAASIKSAQFPFSSWLPRAMEGPTTSSGIFYGSLSVHIGAFILLRTYSFWDGLPLIRYIVIGTGLATSLIATSIARAQSTVKTQVAYASAAQIGFIFMEIALGFHWLALLHFAGNAFLRTYQLLVSPSVLSYLVHDQFYNFNPEAPKKQPGTGFFRKIKNTLYVAGINEWKLDYRMQRLLWDPFKKIGARLDFLKSKSAVAAMVIFSMFGVFWLNYGDRPGLNLTQPLPEVLAALALMLILKAFSERGDAGQCWLLVFAAKFFIALSISLNDDFESNEIILFLSGVIIAGTLGYYCLNAMRKIDNDIALNRYHGYIYERPGVAFLFLLACLAMLGFPITPSFIGIDLMFSHIQKYQVLLITLTSLSYLFIELSVLRCYARVFMGQHKKAFHPMTFKSS
jgi:NADH-quinone oxidoreductase subunit L